jgi:hypothetical protein
MKSAAYVFLWLVTVTSIVSCNSNTPGNKSKQGKVTHDDIIIKAVSKLPKLNLPFGCEELATYNFAKEWAKAINRPQFEEVKYLNIVGHDDSLFMKDLQRFKFTCDFKYRLPDFGPYQCYFQTLKIPEAYHALFEHGGRYLDSYYLAYGSMVFYDPKSKRANVLNVYYESSAQERFGSDYKFFFIDANRVIMLFEAGNAEDGSYFHKSQEVSVQKDGSFSIRHSYQICSVY